MARTGVAVLPCLVNDLRTAPPAARTWLAAARPTRSYGLYWSTGAPATALGRSYDLLVHLHQVEAARLLR